MAEKTEELQHKRVEFTELFYDLVFVYAISKMTGLIHHLHHGVLEPAALGAFLITILFLVNTWMLQMYFTNRYGRNSLLNIVFMFANMGLLLGASNMIDLQWQENFHSFALVATLLSLTIFVEFLIEYVRPGTSAQDKHTISVFALATGVRVMTSALSIVLPLSVGSWLLPGGLILAVFLPLVVIARSRTAQSGLRGTNIPHLIERISLFVILMLGEMIMGIAPFFTPTTFSVRSVLYFLIIALLFLYYFGAFDHAIDESIPAQSVHLTYSHYVLLIGLSFITVSLTFLSEQSANHLFVVSFLYAGLALFQGAILANSSHYQQHLRLTRGYLAVEWGLFVVACAISLLLSTDFLLVTVVTTVYLLAIEIHFMLFFVRGVMSLPEEQRHMSPWL